MPTNNNSIFGFTLQKTICDMYLIEPESEHARSMFKTNYDKALSEKLSPIITRLFKELGLRPVSCHTLERIDGYLVPYNFILEDNSTMSIRTNINKAMVAPRVVGQAGYDTLNEHFRGIYGKEITTQDDIKHLFLNSVDKVLPIFIDHLMDADHIVWFHIDGGSIDYDIFEGNGTFSMKLERSMFSFTRDYNSWNESNSLKYLGKTIAEVQIHANRTFKFRFNLRNMLPMLKANQINNETLGITAELLVCGEYDLDFPSEFRERYAPNIAVRLKPVVREAFRQLPKPIKYTGKDKGSRGGASKCPYDFLLEGNRTLSLKTNWGDKVCPPEVGQPSAETCYVYFKEFLDDDKVTEESFKRMVFKHVQDLLPIYLSHLFDSDYLLRIKETSSEKNAYEYVIKRKGTGADFKWNKDLISFSQPTLEDWNESNTVRYNGVSIGEFQVHKHRNCYKFRFIFDKLLSLLE